VTQSKKRCREILAKVGSPTDSREKECYNLVVKGNIFSSNGDQDEAIRVYNKALQINRNFAPAYNFRGMAFEKLGRYAEALAAYQKAIEISPADSVESGAYWLNKSKLLQSRGSDQEARFCYAKAMALDPSLKGDLSTSPDSSDPLLQYLRPLPAPTGLPPYHLSLEDVLSAERIAEIKASGGVSFHCVGSTGGINKPEPQHAVADAMSADFVGSPTQPAFFYHLGDVIYFYGAESLYYSQFYEPYRNYRAPIFAIPGNHDGDFLPGKSESSLSAFVNNFCSPTPRKSPSSGSFPRTTMAQPNVYWTLEAPFVTVVGLYSNVPRYGEFDDDQKSWLVDELRNASQDKALIVAVHHPPFSLDSFHKGAVGSEYVLRQLDSAFEKSGRSADLVLSADPHNYQRFTRGFHDRQTIYIAAGAGGYWRLKPMMRLSDGKPIKVPLRMPKDGVTLENYCDNQHGYLLLRVTSKSITGTYKAVPGQQQPRGLIKAAEQLDKFELDLQTTH